MACGGARRRTKSRIANELKVPDSVSHSCGFRLIERPATVNLSSSNHPTTTITFRRRGTWIAWRLLDQEKSPARQDARLNAASLAVGASKSFVGAPLLNVRSFRLDSNRHQRAGRLAIEKLAPVCLPIADPRRHSLKSANDRSRHWEMACTYISLGRSPPIHTRDIARLARFCPPHRRPACRPASPRPTRLHLSMAMKRRRYSPIDLRCRSAGCRQA